MNDQLLNSTPGNPPPQAGQHADFPLELRDIHLPDPISWWPPAPGWWLLAALLILIAIAVTITIKIYQSRQLKRDIAAELDQIKQNFERTHNKSQLARALSILLRRVSITYNPTDNIAGLTGDSWLTWLDDTHKTATAKQPGNNKFKSETGRVLLSAPYLPDNAKLDFDASALLRLCESWLASAHSNKRVRLINRAALS